VRVVPTGYAIDESADLAHIKNLPKVSAQCRDLTARSLTLKKKQ
jgi:hypothetical protein